MHLDIPLGGDDIAPGLYLIGMPFLLRRKSGLIDATAPDATELTAYLRGLPRPSLWRRPLRAAGHQLFPINPAGGVAVSGPYVVSRAKTDPGYALVPANILRTDLAAHRPMPDDSELAASIRVLARAQQDAVGDRQQAANKQLDGLPPPKRCVVEERKQFPEGGRSLDEACCLCLLELTQPCSVVAFGGEPWIVERNDSAKMSRGCCRRVGGGQSEDPIGELRGGILQKERQAVGEGACDLGRGLPGLRL